MTHCDTCRCHEEVSGYLEGTGIAWYLFDHEEAKGEIGVRSEAYGLAIYQRDPDGDEGVRRLAYVDLFYQSPEGSRSPGHRPHIDIIVVQPKGLDNAVEEDACRVKVFNDRIDYEAYVE